MRSQVDHSADKILTTLVSLRQRVSRRSWTPKSPADRAARIAFRTVVSLTPAAPAIAPIESVQTRRFEHSAATTASAAASPMLNCTATPGGNNPALTHRRRRSRLAADRGRDPTRCGTGRSCGMTFRSSISSASSCASLSPIVPEPYARQSMPDTRTSSVLGAAMMAHRIASANMRSSLHLPMQERTGCRT